MQNKGQKTSRNLQLGTYLCYSRVVGIWGKAEEGVRQLILHASGIQMYLDEMYSALIHLGGTSCI